jgi:tricorn protease
VIPLNCRNAFAFAATLLAASMLWAAPVSPRPSLTQPALSPDGREIAFASGGDIWTVPANGGDAHLLISNPATESRPLYSPDGSKIAFISTRTGGGDIYVLTLATGQLQRVTYGDTLEQLDAWSPDGKWIYFTNGASDIDYNTDVYRVNATGGTPMPVSAESYLAEFESAPAPDGKSIVLMAKGISDQQWSAMAMPISMTLSCGGSPSRPAANTACCCRMMRSMPGRCGRPMERRFITCRTRQGRRISGQCPRTVERRSD